MDANGPRPEATWPTFMLYILCLCCIYSDAQLARLARLAFPVLLYAAAARSSCHYPRGLTFVRDSTGILNPFRKSPQGARAQSSILLAFGYTWRFERAGIISGETAQFKFNSIYIRTNLEAMWARKGTCEGSLCPSRGPRHV